MQTAIPCTFMRGGTSRGLYFVLSDLPSDTTTRDRVIIELYGNNADNFISGVGGDNSVMNKVAIVSKSASADADIDYCFGQVNSAQGIVDTGPTCGNMLAGVGPFAIERGLVSAQPGTTIIHIRDVNTGALVTVEVQTPEARVEYDGDTRLGGLVEAAAPIPVTFLSLAGNKTGHMLPTGKAQDMIDGVPVSLVDIAMPMVLINATSLGLQGNETAPELNQQTALLERLEQIRLQASLLMGLGDAQGKVIPKMAILSAPRHGGHITSRYFVPDRCHPAHAVSGAFCVSGASVVPDTVANKIIQHPDTMPRQIAIEHPSGTIDVTLDASIKDSVVTIHSAGMLRTAKRIMSGMVYVSDKIWRP